MEHRVVLINKFKDGIDIKEKIVEALKEEVRKYDERKSQVKHNAQSSREIDSEDTLELRNKFIDSIEGISNFNIIGTNIIRFTIYSDVEEEGFKPLRKRYNPHRTIFEIPRCLKATCILCIKENKAILYLPTISNDKIDSLFERLLRDILFIRDEKFIRLTDSAFRGLKEKIENLTSYSPSLDFISILADISGDTKRVCHFNLSIPYERRNYEEIIKNNPFNFLKVRMSLKVPRGEGHIPIYITIRNKAHDVVGSSFEDKEFGKIAVVYNLISDLFLN